MGLRLDFHSRLQDFLERHRMSQRAFCRHSACDPKLFFRLRHGHAYTLATLEDIEAWMSVQDAELETCEQDNASDEPGYPVELEPLHRQFSIPASMRSALLAVMMLGMSSAAVRAAEAVPPSAPVTQEALDAQHRKDDANQAGAHVAASDIAHPEVALVHRTHFDIPVGQLLALRMDRELYSVQVVDKHVASDGGVYQRGHLALIEGIAPGETDVVIRQGKGDLEWTGVSPDVTIVSVRVVPAPTPTGAK